MCKKLSVLLLVVAALCIPASADYIGMGNELRVDIDGQNTTNAIPSWQQWLFAGDWTGPVNKSFVNPNYVDPWEIPNAQFDVYSGGTVRPPNMGSSRSRNGGMAYVAGTGEFQPTAKGFGMNYVKLTLTGLEPSASHNVYLWSYEARGVWVINSDNPNRKYAAWSTANPVDWMAAHAGEFKGNGAGDSNGYGPISPDDDPFPITDSNMPGSVANPYTGTGLSLWDMTERTTMESDDALSHEGRMLNCTKITVTTDSAGAVTLYGWMDATDYGNSMHMPLEGFLVVPEPATIALLGLGGLALIRRKRA